MSNTREEREAARLERKRQIAQQQAQQFEDELSGHELNIARLEAVPEDKRPTDYEQTIAQSEAAIETITAAIDATLAIAEEAATVA